ncbi:MAG TPA: tripartite tricarboxylate transporter TctB family protein [Jiangellaceae bacterium]
MSAQGQVGRAVPVGELVFAAGIAGLGVFALARAGSIVEPVTAGVLGPRVLPYIVGTALVILGLATLIRVLRGHFGEAEKGEDIDPHAHTHWPTVVILVALLALHAALIVPLGWPVAAAVLFVGAAWTFGAKPRHRAVLIGVPLALVLQAAFAGGLGLSLPPGPLLEGVPIFSG